MRKDGSLHPSLWDWADHLDQLGNEGAHPEDYDEVTSEEATALATLVGTSSVTSMRCLPS